VMGNPSSRANATKQVKVGVFLYPQFTTVKRLRNAWEYADRIGLDSIWTWDHFFPTVGQRNGAHFEGWSLLAAMAVTTSRALFGMRVTANSYRNPDLLADMARTVDHLSGGRLVLGIGAGHRERDYVEYGYYFGSAAERLRDLELSLDRIKRRLKLLDPPPLGPLPILIGGGGERVTLRLVAQYANIWDFTGSGIEDWRKKSQVLDQWCSKIGRDALEIERMTHIHPSELDQVDALVQAGLGHIVLRCPDPFDLGPAAELLNRLRR
jgi:probable F420-dependent oxidoreductase